MKQGLDRPVKTTSFQNPTHNRNTIRKGKKRKRRNFAAIALSISPDKIPVLLADNRQCTIKPSHIAREEEKKNK